MTGHVIKWASAITAILWFGMAKTSRTTEVELTNKPISADTMRFEQVFTLGLQGDVPAALHLMDSLPLESLTPRQQVLKAKFVSRFRTFDENLPVVTSDSVVSEVISIYQDYWRRGLLFSDSLYRLDTVLAERVVTILKDHSPELKDSSQLTLMENFPTILNEFLSRKGVYSATGKTGSFFDLLLHTKESESTFAVTTPEDTIGVEVVFMEEIISNGWEEFATLGKYYPGGWATNDALYCAKGSYDLASENFKVSYLMHEGKHFADYKRFPTLSSADLEYRAKLVELSAADLSLFPLLKFFNSNSLDNPQVPHSFANYCVTRDLIAKLGLPEATKDDEWWKSTGKSKIHDAAASLLKLNSQKLAAAGADTVTTVLK